MTPTTPALILTLRGDDRSFTSAEDIADYLANNSAADGDETVRVNGIEIPVGDCDSTVEIADMIDIMTAVAS